MGKYSIILLFSFSTLVAQIRKGDAFRNRIDSLNRVAFDAPVLVAAKADSMLVIAKKRKRPIDIGLLLMVKGITETCRGHNDSALKYHMRAYSVFDSLHIDEGKVFSLCNLATVELNIENYRKARAYLFKALRITDKHDANNLKTIYNNLGVAYDNEADYERAIYYYKKAIPYMSGILDYNSVALNYHNMSVAYNALHNFKKAEYYGLQALAYQRKSNSKRTLAIVTLTLGILYTEHDQLEKGGYYLDLSGKVARDLKTPYYIQSYYEEKCKWLRKKGDYQQAVLYSDSLIRISNTIYSDEKLKATTEMEAKFENNIKSKEIQLLKIQKQLQDSELKKNVTWRYVLVLISTLCLVIIFILYRNYKLKQKANYLLSKEKDALAQQNLQLENENILVQFETLRNQVSPHFLFNSLNALSSLIKTNQVKAVEFTTLFSKIFRNVLELKEKHLITIEDELQHVMAYLELQKMRFGDNLIVELKIDADVLHYYLPPFSLQMVIENAVKHNIISSGQPLTIVISNSDEYLIISNTLQQRSAVEDSTKTGLKNIVSRYRYISSLVPVFEIRHNRFVVELPLIKEEHP